MNYELRIKYLFLLIRNSLFMLNLYLGINGVVSLGK